MEKSIFPFSPLEIGMPSVDRRVTCEECGKTKDMSNMKHWDKDTMLGVCRLCSKQEPEEQFRTTYEEELYCNMHGMDLVRTQEVLSAAW